MTPDDVNFTVDIFSNLGALGFVFWLVWRTTNHTIPRLAKSFEEGLKDARTDFKEGLKDSRTDFRDGLKQQRDDFASILNEHKTYFTSQVNLLRDWDGHSRR